MFGVSLLIKIWDLSFCSMYFVTKPCGKTYSRGKRLRQIIIINDKSNFLHVPISDPFRASCQFLFR